MSTGSPRPTTPARASSPFAGRPEGDGRQANGPACAGRRRRSVVVAAAACVVALAVTGCGGSSGGGDDAERQVYTTDAGTTIVRTTAEKGGLRVEVQDSSVYVSMTDATPADLRASLKGKPLGGRCTLKDGRTIGTIQLLWREDPGDWGASLEVQGVYEEREPLANVVRSCDLRQGVAAGPGATDVNAGPVLTTASFEEE